MPILPINDKYSYHPAQHAKSSAQQTNQNSTSTLASENSDSVDFSKTSNYSPAYTKSSGRSGKTGNAQFADNRSTRQMKNDMVRDMAKNTIANQAGKGNSILYKPLNKSGAVMDALKAAEATSEGKDYWGVEATAERIFTFAKTLAGDDEKMFKTMKDAFLKGFEQALGAKGGKLPSISYQTKDKVLSMFDDWEKEINSNKTSTTNTKSEDKTETNTSKTNPTTTVAGRTYGAETVPIYGQGKYNGYSGTPVKDEK